mmetsp:Transcript_114044/g.254496  ORF Transcript_114044/g.254496 Transcript_114044/m.254496 type:complete len:614 (+) Transcript_114044:42-1883(+)
MDIDLAATASLEAVVTAGDGRSCDQQANFELEDPETDESTRLVVKVSRSDYVAGSRGKLMRGAAKAAVCWTDLEVDEEVGCVPCDESLRFCEGQLLQDGCRVLPYGGATASSSSAAAPQRRVSPRRPGQQGATGAAVRPGQGAAGASGCLMREAPLLRGGGLRKKSSSHRELDRHNERSHSWPRCEALERKEVDSPLRHVAPRQAPSPSPALPAQVCVPTSKAAEKDMVDLAARHDLRRRFTGTVCIEVRYADRELPLEDVPELSCSSNGRLFVQELMTWGQAYRAGVRHGDELVRIRVGCAGPLSPKGSTNILEEVAKLDPLRDESLPVAVFFLGFWGKFPAEVKMAMHPEDLKCGVSHLSQTVGKASFQVCEEVIFDPGRARLFLVTEAGTEIQESPRKHKANVRPTADSPATDFEHEEEDEETEEVTSTEVEDAPEALLERESSKAAESCRRLSAILELSSREVKGVLALAMQELSALGMLVEWSPKSHGLRRAGTIEGSAAAYLHWCRNDEVRSEESARLSDGKGMAGTWPRKRRAPCRSAGPRLRSSAAQAGDSDNNPAVQLPLADVGSPPRLEASLAGADGQSPKSLEARTLGSGSDPSHWTGESSF